MWLHKKQNLVKTSNFGSEFIALKLAVELVTAFRYKLRMFVVPLEGPTFMFYDNEEHIKLRVHGVQETSQHCIS